MIYIDPAILEGEAHQIEGLRDEFSSRLDVRKAAVESLEWDGEGRRAFVDLFTELRVQMASVEDVIGTIAAVLRDAKDGMIEMDEEIAATIRRNA